MLDFALYVGCVSGWLVAYAAFTWGASHRQNRDRLLTANRLLSDGLRFASERIEELEEQVDVWRIKQRFWQNERLPN